MWNVFDKIGGGLKGGRSKSKAKKAAARRNGKKGGRPVGSGRTRTLGEFLMRRKLTSAQYEQVREGYFQLRGEDGARGEKYQFRRFFGVPLAINVGRFKSVDYDFLKATDYHARRPKAGTEMHLILAKFLLVARSRLKS